MDTELESVADSAWPSQGACPDEEALLLFVAREAALPAAVQIQAHLSGCARCQLTAQLVASSGDLPSAPARGPRTFGNALLIAGRYWVVRLIGRGGMGEVYEVEDRLLPGPRIALKTLPSTHLDDPRALARFRTEVLLARRVSSPHVCRILEFGVHDEGREDAVPFLTMELLVGETLAARLARVGRMDEAQVRRLALQMVAGLQAMHAAGVIHRDLKPENVILVPGEGGERPPTDERAVVLDFGLARSVREPAGARGSTGALVVGTPDYVAPEQVQGKAVGPATDVYSLGVVLFEMFSGRRPFSGACPLEVATRRLDTPAPPLSSLVPIGRSCERIVARCLARDPAQRFAGMEALAAALRARPASGRRRWAAAVVALACLVVAAGVLAARGPGAASGDPPLAVGPTPRAPAPPAAADEARAVAVAVAAVPPPAAPRTASPAAVPAATDAAAARASTRRRPGGLQRELAIIQTLFRQGHHDRACARVGRARSSAAAPAKLYQLLGRCAMRRGRVEEAKGFYRRYLELSPRADDAPFMKGILNR
jgi:hypothetical protein